MRVAGRAMVRAGLMLAALPIILLATAQAGAAAQQSARLAQVRTDTVPFGLLGPVGLIAIALGMAGMVAGAVRHRRRVRATAEAELSAEETDLSQQATHPILAPVDARD